MASSSSSETQKSEHLRLAGIVKGVHKRLRRQFRESDGDYASVWKEHLKEQDVLHSYAEAMRSLAEQHWAVAPDSRIEWCRKVVHEYFMSGGWRKTLEKDTKRRYFEQKRQIQLCGSGQAPLHLSTSGHDNEQIGCPFKEKMTSLEDAYSVKHDDDAGLVPKVTFRHETGTIALPLQHSPLSRLFGCTGIDTSEVARPKVKLLDVGSCYNPFQAFQGIDAIGVDLCPAMESVYQCDFLELEVLPPPLPPLPPSNNSDVEAPPLSSSTSTVISHLPGSSFHVVVFSLLLEYLPSSAQRLVCCMKAHTLLAMHGLLVIITPDSNSQQRNAPMMKSWRDALEQIGFSRWKYEKKEHIHCLAFRKVSEIPEKTSLDETSSGHLAEKLFIPQDFNDACYDEKDSVPKSAAVDENSGSNNELFLTEVQDELPFMLSFDSDSNDDTGWS